jgi:hypothetical protein
MSDQKPEVEETDVTVQIEAKDTSEQAEPAEVINPEVDEVRAETRVQVGKVETAESRERKIKSWEDLSKYLVKLQKGELSDQDAETIMTEARMYLEDMTKNPDKMSSYLKVIDRIDDSWPVKKLRWLYEDRLRNWPSVRYVLRNPYLLPTMPQPSPYNTLIKFGFVKDTTFGMDTREFDKKVDRAITITMDLVGRIGKYIQPELAPLEIAAKILGPTQGAINMICDMTATHLQQKHAGEILQQLPPAPVEKPANDNLADLEEITKAA